MSAARHIPMEEVVQPISITASFVPTPQGVIVPSGTIVQFTNNSQSTVNIVFNPNPFNSTGPLLFSNISNLGPGATNSQAPTAPNGSVNYFVNVVGGGSYGPFAIQVGTGVLFLQVTYQNSAGQCHPGEAALPMGGTLGAQSADSHSYQNITWTPKNPFTTNLSSIGPQLATYTANAAAGSYTYGLPVAASAASTAGGILLGGGGKVIIRGT